MFEDPSLGADYSRFVALCPMAERACREMVWLEHRILLGEQADMDDIVAAVARINGARQEFEAVRFVTNS